MIENNTCWSKDQSQSNAISSCIGDMTIGQGRHNALIKREESIDRFSKNLSEPLNESKN